MNIYEAVRNHEEKLIFKDLEFAKTLKFKTEKELFDWIQKLKSVEEQSILQNRWDLGTVIIRFYNKEYGKDKLQKISDEVGYSKSTLHKACQFARNFTVKHLRTLIEGSVSLSWRDVAQNLKVNPDAFVKAYSDSETVDEFRNAVTELKATDEITIGLRRLYPRKKGYINCEYRLIMKNQVNYLDFQLNLKEREVAELKGRITELMVELDQYRNELSENKTAEQIDDVKDQNLAAVAA